MNKALGKKKRGGPEETRKRGPFKVGGTRGWGGGGGRVI